MKFYISKPKTHKKNEALITGIKALHPDAVFVNDIKDADVCVFQKGWTKSKTCVEEYHFAGNQKIKRVDGYIYTDKCTARPT